jgi:Tfp pilus assembly protein PilV
VIIALTILLITVLPLSYLLTSAVSSAANSRQRVAALQLADSWLEVLSNSTLPTTGGAIITNVPQNPASFPGLSATTTQLPKSTLAGTAFAVQANFTTQSVNNQGQSDLCSSGQPPSPSHPAVILLHITVTWNRGNNSVNDTTAVNYPKPGLQTQGFLAVQLTNSGSPDVYTPPNQASDRLQAVPVSLHQDSQANPSDPPLSPNPLTLHADDNGCVFAQVPTGSYTVSLGQPSSGTPSAFHGYTGVPPYVATTGSTSDTSSTTVVVTAESMVQLTAFDGGITTSLGYGTSSAVDQGVTCPGTSVVTCVASGNGTTGASEAWGGTGSPWSSTMVSGTQNLSPWACTTGSPPTCVGVGNSSGAGVIRTTASNPGTTSSDTPPAGVTNLTQIICPSNQGCYALGTTAAGPVLVAGAVGQSSPQHDTWAVVAPPSTTFTGLSSVACPTSSTCEVGGSAKVGASPSAPVMLRLDGDPAGLATNPTWTPTFSTDTLPSTVTSVGKIVCPTSVLCEAIGLGDSTSGTDPTVLTSAIAATPTSTWSAESTFPSGAGSVSDISCTSTTCVAIGTATGTAAVWTGDLTESPHDWSVATGIPSSISAVSAVACGFPANGDDADCAITATAPNLSAPGQLLEGSLTGGSWAWNFATPPSGVTVRYYAGVACEPSPGSGRAACAAVGATTTGPIIVTSANGPAGAWTGQTPSALPGALVTGIPLETAPATTTNWTTQVPAGQPSNAFTLPSVLYPFANGYSIAAGDCLAEATSASATSLNAAPSGTASATLPVGLLPLQVVSHTLVPVGGATVKLTATTPGCGGDQYTLPITDANGITRTSVPYGTYSYTVTISGATTSPSPAVTLKVDTSTVTTTNGMQAPTNYLPNLVVVAAS